jgi:hypothetical protein
MDQHQLFLPDNVFGASEGLLKIGLLCCDVAIWLFLVPAACLGFA